MRKQALKIFDQKLTDALRVIDDKVLSEGRALWKNIAPAPSCPHIKDVMWDIQHVLGRGHVTRGETALQLISETVASYEKLLSLRFSEELMEVVKEAFPRDHYVKFAYNTQGVYARQAQNHKNKFNERIFKIELSLIKASSSNMANQTISRVQTFLDDALLKKKLNKHRWWVRASSGFWKIFAAPLFKWIFGIISAILAAILIACLGVK